MNFSDVKADDPRWTAREALVFFHLFKQRQRYIDEKRKDAAHGISKAIFVMANVLEAVVSQPKRRSSDVAENPDPFRELL